MKTNKSPKSIRNIRIAAIKRKIVQREFKFTRFYETENLENLAFVNLSDFEFEVDELPIASIRQFLKENENWWVISTHKIFGKIDNQVKAIPFENINSIHWGDFKGYLKKEETTAIRIKLKNNKIETFFIETGAAAMIPIYAINF